MKKFELLLVVLSLVMFTGCDFKNKEKSGEKEETVNVVTFLNSNIVSKNEKNAKISIPQINSTKPNAISLNNKILNNYLLRIYDMGYYASACKTYDSCINHNRSIAYEYNIKNNIIAISVESTIDSVPSTSYGDEKFDSYFYDIINDKELTFKEAAPKLGFTFGKKEEQCGYFYIENGTPKIDYIGMGCVEGL